MSVPRLVVAPMANDRDGLDALAGRAVGRGFACLLVDESVGPPSLGSSVRLLERRSDRIVNPDPLEEIPIVVVRSPEDTAPILSLLRAGRPVAVRWTAERVIPLENLVAARAVAGTLWAITDRAEEVPAFLGALEHGAHHVVVEIRSSDDLDRLEGLLDQLPLQLAWEQFPLRRVHPAGQGDRVIVDTTSLLAPEEGLLVGSQAAVLLHVASEAVGSRYTRARPFRVNAGAAHLYTLLANGETRYLSELVAGDPVVVTRPGGASRTVRVGRVKIERRPLTLIEVEHRERRYTAFLQEAETVRLTTSAGRVATTDLRPGSNLLGVVLPPARHLGTAIEETIEER